MQVLSEDNYVTLKWAINKGEGKICIRQRTVYQNFIWTIHTFLFKSSVSLPSGTMPKETTLQKAIAIFIDTVMYLCVTIDRVRIGESIY
jgi:hypothetical protein